MSLLNHLIECIKKEAFESPFDTDVVYDVNESDCGCDHENDDIRESENEQHI